MAGSGEDWDGTAVRTWLGARREAARADQVTAERGGRERQDDCDKAAAEEMVCASLMSDKTSASQATFVAHLKGLMDRDSYIWRGIYDDQRFDRHARSYIRKLMRMARTNEGVFNLNRYQ